MQAAVCFEFDSGEICQWRLSTIKSRRGSRCLLATEIENDGEEIKHGNHGEQMGLYFKPRDADPRPRVLPVSAGGMVSHLPSLLQERFMSTGQTCPRMHLLWFIKTRLKDSSRLWETHNKGGGGGGGYYYYYLGSKHKCLLGPKGSPEVTPKMVEETWRGGGGREK